MLVEYLDHMGTDLSVVDAARVSFDKKSEWEVVLDDFGINHPDEVTTHKQLKKSDEKLIGFLAKNNHFTPFTHAVAKFRWTVPIFMARQLFKHQIGLSVNEVSRRYVDSDPEFFMPEKWRKRHDNAKQGSSDEEVTMFAWESSGYAFPIHKTVQEFYDHSLEVYRSLLISGVCPEQARMVLPQSMMTSCHWTGTLAAWARIYGLRAKPDAQKEHAVLMTQLDGHMSKLFPVSWKALTAR